jgi:hypothetical protein
MLNEKQLSNLKSKFPEPAKLVQAVNVGSHNEAIKQAKAVVQEQAGAGVVDAKLCGEELLQLLLPQVTEEITLEDTFYDWISVKDWVAKHPKLNPAHAGWTLEGDMLYMPRQTHRPVIKT